MRIQQTKNSHGIFRHRRTGKRKINPPYWLNALHDLCLLISIFERRKSQRHGSVVHRSEGTPARKTLGELGENNTEHYRCSCHQQHQDDATEASHRVERKHQMTITWSGQRKMLLVTLVSTCCESPFDSSGRFPPFLPTDLSLHGLRVEVNTSAMSFTAITLLSSHGEQFCCGLLP